MVSQSLQGGVAVQGALDRALQLTGRTRHCLVQSHCLVRDGGGLMPLESRLHTQRIPSSPPLVLYFLERSASLKKNASLCILDCHRGVAGDDGRSQPIWWFFAHSQYFEANTRRTYLVIAQR